MTRLTPDQALDIARQHLLRTYPEEWFEMVCATWNQAGDLRWTVLYREKTPTGAVYDGPVILSVDDATGTVEE